MAVGMRETVLVPRFSRVLCVLVIGVCVAVLVSTVVIGRPELLARYGPAAALVSVAAVVLFWLPRIRIGPAELEIVNPLVTHVVTWPAVVDIETKWTLTVVTARRRIQVYAAPAPGPFGSVGSRRREREGALTRDASAATLASVGDLAASIALLQWRDYRDRGLLGAVEGEGETRRLHTAWIAALAVLAVLTVAGLVWP